MAIVVVFLILYFRRKSKSVNYENTTGANVDNVEIYELDIQNHSDSKWRNLWSMFESTCDHPNQALQSFENIQSPSEVHAECHSPMDRQKWDTFEMTCKQLPPTGPPAQNGWVQNNYKFRKDYNFNEKQIKGVSVALSPIIEEFPTFRGNFYYPPGGCREWHTNRTDMPGWRLYIIKNNPAGSSFFNIYDEKKQEVVSFPDQAGMVRLFKINPNHPLWHTIVSNGDRWSIGFTMSDRAVKKLQQEMNLVYNNSE